MINKTKLILLVIGALLVLGGAFFATGAYHKYVSVVEERDAYRNNQRAYEEVVSNKTNENRVLELSNTDLRYSNDKMVQTIDSIKKSLKKPANNPGDISAGVGTSIHAIDTVKINNPDSFKLDTTIYFNQYTKNRIKIEKSMLIPSIDINNSMYLYVYSLREFVNVRRGWLDRLIHLDYKKENVDRYAIKNTNDLIHVDSVRVIKTR
jgi:hypothetical protein